MKAFIRVENERQTATTPLSAYLYNSEAVDVGGNIFTPIFTLGETHSFKSFFFDIDRRTVLTSEAKTVELEKL